MVLRNVEDKTFQTLYSVVALTVDQAEAGVYPVPQQEGIQSHPGGHQGNIQDGHSTPHVVLREEELLHLFVADT